MSERPRPASHRAGRSSNFASPYRGYDVMRKWDSASWNEKTREVVYRRLNEVPERAFFDRYDWATLEAVCTRLVPQPDRPSDPVPIVPWIDQRLAQDKGDGYRYADMPPDREAWRQGLRAIDDECVRRHGKRFAEVGEDEQDAVLRAVQKGETESEQWNGLPPKRFFQDQLLKTMVGIYYAHPAAWSEVGYGGPASPRGYVRTTLDGSDPWEAEEQWNPVALEARGREQE